MRHLLLAFTLVALIVGCSHMPGIVKDVSWDKDGNLVIRKCDHRHLWVLYVVVWEETNCREEVRKL